MDAILHRHPSGHFRVCSRRCSCGCHRRAERERLSRMVSFEKNMRLFEEANARLAQ
jgi:hypothetical protein